MWWCATLVAERTELAVDLNLGPQAQCLCALTTRSPPSIYDYIHNRSRTLWGYESRCNMLKLCSCGISLELRTIDKGLQSIVYHFNAYEHSEFPNEHKDELVDGPYRIG